MKSCRNVQYMKIKLKHFQKSGNRGLIAEIEPLPNRCSASFYLFVDFTYECLNEHDPLRRGLRFESEQLIATPQQELVS